MHHKKLFYIPGLISLLGLPVLLFLMGPEDPAYHTVLQIRLPADKAPANGQLSFNKVEFLHLIKDKKLISVDIDDYGLDELPNYAFHRKLAFVPRELERLQFTGDTNAVFRLRLGENNNYGQFIWAINMAKIYRIRRYAFIDNDFYYLPDPPPERIFMDELPLIDDVVTVRPYTPPTWWQLFTRRFSRWWDEVLFDIKGNLWLIIGFLVFILVPGLIGLRGRVLRAR